MSSDPFTQYFSRDFISSRDFARMHGIDRDVYLRIARFAMKECRDPTRGGMVEKPVIYFVEHKKTPMFINKTQHEFLEDRFGFGYSLDENRSKYLHAPIHLIAGRENIGGKMQVSVQYVDENYPDHTAPIGKDAAAKLGIFLKDEGIEGFSRDRLRNFVHHEYPEVAPIFDSSEGLADMPWLFRQIIDECIDELRSDLTPKGPPPPTGPEQGAPPVQGASEPPAADFSTPEQRKARAGKGSVEYDKPGGNREVGITHDEIPF